MKIEIEFDALKKIRMIYRKITPFQMITLSFSLAIILGSLLLYLPISRRGAENVSYLDALFTSCSAVCVTGLVVQNTATFWTVFGKSVILALIQIGGLGVITFVIASSILTGKRIGLRQRNLMQNAVNAPKIGGIVRFTRFLVLFTFLTEAAGAMLLTIPFVRTYGYSGIGKAVFHSISAFCNAGFDLLGDKEPYVSLTSFRDNGFLNVVIMLLIVGGGLGFLTWEDLIFSRFRWKKLRVQTKLILVVTAILLVFPAIMFFLFEFTGEPFGRRILLSVFQSTTTRTAGFNTADIGKMSEWARLIMVLLMLIGGSPGSTAGGLKTTTFAVIMISVTTFIRRKKYVGAFSRSFNIRLIWEAFTLLMLYLGLLFIGTTALSMLENLPVIDCLFECASALGTVGLTTGITPTLGSISKIILILFMYFGRVGGLTLAYSALSGGKPDPGRAPEEAVMVG